MVVVWLIVNPIMFPSPRTIKRGQRGRCSERRCGSPSALDRAMALSMGATAFGLGGVWELTSDVIATAVCTFGQVALLLAWREMALYYERHRGERG